MELPVDVLKRLSPWGFDPQLLERFAARARAAESNAVKGALTPPDASDLTALPEPGTPLHRELVERGREALSRQQVGAVILAGGMATRFGGVVKAAVPVIGGKTFLQLKLEQIHRVAPSARVLVMSSFATHEVLVEHLRGAPHTEVFPQSVSLRLTPEGTLFKERDGDFSPYATGHGDLPHALRTSGALQRFLDGGGELLMMSNVDNLGATLDPAVIGAHLARGAALTAEVVRKEKGDKGGAPARLDGRPQIIEGFRFPRDFDQDSIPVFNTNTFMLNARALTRDFPLPYYRVEKQVEGATVIQFERLVGELTAFLDSVFLEVPRSGAQSRFLPVKDPDELTQRLAEIELVTVRSHSP